MSWRHLCGGETLWFVSICIASRQQRSEHLLPSTSASAPTQGKEKRMGDEAQTDTFRSQGHQTLWPRGHTETWNVGVLLWDSPSRREPTLAGNQPSRLLMSSATSLPIHCQKWPPLLISQRNHYLIFLARSASKFTTFSVLPMLAATLWNPAGHPSEPPPQRKKEWLWPCG